MSREILNSVCQNTSTMVAVFLTGIACCDKNAENPSANGVVKPVRPASAVSPYIKKRSVLENLHKEMAPHTQWARESSKQLVESFRKLASRFDGWPKVTGIDCRGQHLCRVELAYGAGSKTRQILHHMRNGDDFSWKGTVESIGLSPSRQLLFLIAEGYRLQGEGLQNVSYATR